MEFKEKMLQFLPDAGLMYLIQQTTKQSTDEILGFFYDFGKEVFIIGVQNMSGRSIRKDIQAMYPGTAIPFKLLVKAHKWHAGIGGSLEVTFPDNPTYMNTEKLMEMIMEKTLLGGASLPDFDAPKSRTPKLYKDLIQQVLRKDNEQTLCDSGHTRATGPSDEALGRPNDESQPGSI
jgi:hypothetical protein